MFPCLQNQILDKFTFVTTAVFNFSQCFNHDKLYRIKSNFSLQDNKTITLLSMVGLGNFCYTDGYPGLSCQRFKQRKHKNINLQTEMCSFQRMIKHFYKSSFLEAINSSAVFKSTHLQAAFYFYLATYCQFVQEWYFRGFKGGKR